MSEQNKGPIDTIYDGNLRAKIWERKSDKGAFYSTTLARTYKDADGNLRDSHDFAGTDLLRVSELSRKAYDRTNELRREQFQQSRQQSEPRAQSQTQDRRER